MFELLQRRLPAVIVLVDQLQVFGDSTLSHKGHSEGANLARGHRFSFLFGLLLINYGVSSFIYHASGSERAQLLDTLAQHLLALFFLVYCAVRFLQWSCLPGTMFRVFLVSFLCAGAGLVYFDSLFYTGVWCDIVLAVLIASTLITIGIYHFVRPGPDKSKVPGWRWFWVAILSLGFAGLGMLFDGPYQKVPCPGQGVQIHAISQFLQATALLALYLFLRVEKTEDALDEDLIARVSKPSFSVGEGERSRLGRIRRSMMGMCQTPREFLGKEGKGAHDEMVWLDHPHPVEFPARLQTPSVSLDDDNSQAPSQICSPSHLSTSVSVKLGITVDGAMSIRGGPGLDISVEQPTSPLSASQFEETTSPFSATRFENQPCKAPRLVHAGSSELGTCASNSKDKSCSMSLHAYGERIRRALSEVNRALSEVDSLIEEAQSKSFLVKQGEDSVAEILSRPSRKEEERKGGDIAGENRDGSTPSSSKEGEHSPGAMESMDGAQGKAADEDGPGGLGVKCGLFCKQKYNQSEPEEGAQSAALHQIPLTHFQDDSTANVDRDCGIESKEGPQAGFKEGLRMLKEGEAKGAVMGERKSESFVHVHRSPIRQGTRVGGLAKSSSFPMESPASCRISDAMDDSVIEIWE
eukprot:g39215.t1